MKSGWEVPILVLLTWLVLVAVIQAATSLTDLLRDQLLTGTGAAFLAVFALILFFSGKGDAEGDEPDEVGFVRPSEELDAFAGGFPVPLLPGQTLPPSPHASHGVASPGGPEASGSGLSVSGKADEPAESQPGAVAPQAGSAAPEAGGAVPQADTAECQAGAATTVEGDHG